jgi:NADH-quinone oxidoreductase subunit N
MATPTPIFIPAPFGWAELLPALPEILLFLGTAVVMMFDVFVKPERRRFGFALAMLTLLVSIGAVLMRFDEPSVKAFTGMFVDDPMARVLKVALLVAVAVTLLYGRDYMRTRHLLSGEYLTLTLFATLGMMVMISANNFLSLYVGLELLALSLYAIVALQRDSARATEAAMKYFILGALASGLLLYGVSMIYGATGALDIAAVAQSIEGGRAHATLTTFGLVFIVCGLAFKLGAVPFHMWVPDVYQGAATPTALLIGAAPKIAALAFVLRILAEGLQGVMTDWRQMLIVLAVLSIGLGNVVAIAQTNIKRMLAYSTISHMGFLILGILAGTLNGYASAMFYVVTYALTTLLAFGVILMLSRDGFEAEELDDFKGLNTRSKMHAALVLIVMFSLAGIPPTVGFFGKLLVLQAALDVGLTWLVVYAVLLSVVGAFYYLRIVKLVYMDDPVDNSPLVISRDMSVALSVNALLILVLGVLPAPLIALFQTAVARSIL